MPLYQVESGTDWAATLPEIGKQISDVIKNRQEKPAAGAQKAIELASMNPDLLKPENEAMLAQLMGREWSPEGATLARQFGGTPAFQEMVKARMSQLKTPTAQLGGIEAETKLRTEQANAAVPEAEARKAMIDAQRDAAEWERKRVTLTQFYGDKEAERQVKAARDELQLHKDIALANLDIHKTQLALQSGQITAAAADKIYMAKLEDARGAYNTMTEGIKDLSHQLTSKEFAAMDDSAKAFLLSRGATLMAGLVNAQGAMHTLGVPGVDTQTHMATLLQGLYWASGKNPAEFAKNYESFLSELPPEERTQAQELALNTIRSRQRGKPGATTDTSKPFGFFNPAPGSPLGKVKEVSKTMYGPNQAAWDAIATILYKMSAPPE